MPAVRPYVLTIAGFDPSGGAGLIADIKTLEMNRAYGLGICSALTCQNDEIFDNVEWLNTDKIIRQIKVLSGRYDFEIVKIGLIDINNSLPPVIEYLTEMNEKIRIVWDPVLWSSSGYTFHESYAGRILKKVINNVYLVTPNIDEAKVLTGNTENPEQGITDIIRNTNCSVLMKGGHAEGDAKDDILFQDGRKIAIRGESIEGYSKHGTGCVLSSAIAAGLSMGKALEDSCREAKEYTRKFILSNKSNLGYHYE